MKYQNLIGHQLRELRHRNGWSLQQVTIQLQLTGWEISLDDMRKIEARIRVVPDYELNYFTDVFRVDITALYPMQPLTETTHHYVTRLMGQDC